MSLRTSSLPVSIVSFRHGLSGVRFGSMPLNHVIPEFQLMFSSSVRWTSRWFTTTGCSREGCPISPSARTILPGYGCLFRRCRPWLSVPCLLWFRPARAFRGTFCGDRVSSKDTTCPPPDAPDSNLKRSYSYTVTDYSGSGCPGVGGSFVRLTYDTVALLGLCRPHPAITECYATAFPELREIDCVPQGGGGVISGTFTSDLCWQFWLLHCCEAFALLVLSCGYVAGLRFGCVLYSVPRALVVFNYVLCKYVAGLIQAGSFLPVGSCVISW